MPVASHFPLLDFEIMVERETGRPRGFGFITFSDRRAVEESIRDMHGREFGDRTISVNRAEPKFGGGDVDRGFGFSYPLSERDGYGGSGGGGDRLVAQDECFKCGRVGHWARECPTSGGGGGRVETNDFPYSSSKSKYAPSNTRTERFGSERDRYAEDKYDIGGGGGGRYSERGADRVEGSRYMTRDRYTTTNESRYLPSGGGGDRLGGGDRYGGGSDRYVQNGYGKDRMYERDSGMRGGGGGGDRYDKYDRYGGGGGGVGGGGGPSRSDRNRGYRGRPDPYERPARGGGRLSSFDRY